MVDADARGEAAAHHPPCDDGSKHSVTVVQKGVDAWLVAVSSERRPEEERPIRTGALPLNIALVSSLNFSDERCQRRMRLVTQA